MIGALLFQLIKDGATVETLIEKLDYKMILFAQKVASMVVTKNGAINAMPTQEEIKKYFG